MYSVALLGATGLVGQKMLQILEEENFPIKTLKPLASEKSKGKKVCFKGEFLEVEEATENSFDDIDIVLASAGTEASLKFGPIAVQKGALFIDNSKAFRLDKETPLILVGVNDEDMKAHHGILANPNCSTSQIMPVLNALKKISPLKRLIVSTYQATSGAGSEAVSELYENTKAALQGEKFTSKKFKKPIAFNVLPQIDTFCENGYTGEEMKVVFETRKILHLSDNFPISCTAVRVPVDTGHSEALSIEFESPLCPQKAKEILSQTPGIIVQDMIDAYDYPTPLEAAGKNPVYVGRIRKDIAFENGLCLWCVADNLRIGAALNAVRIAQKAVEMGLVKKHL
ncbi:MAG: aspartate-semialdehyde dehydrogenase [Alphaproteobacteria bacterium]|nr:aspartate-semialdehyde dehydrogenase [Alphaproteobacteria bacterium]